MNNNKTSKLKLFSCVLFLALSCWQCERASSSTEGASDSIEAASPVVEVAPATEDALASPAMAELEESAEAIESTSLLAQRSNINQEDAMNRLISMGTPLNVAPQEPNHKMIERTSMPTGRRELLAYGKLSFFKYLEDLRLLSYYQQLGLARNDLPLVPSNESTAGIKHEELAYPLTRPKYWLEGQESFATNSNHRSSTTNNEQVNNSYQTLISLYELGLNKNYSRELRLELRGLGSPALFYEEYPREGRQNNFSRQFLPTIVYEQARTLITARKQKEEARLQTLFAAMKSNRSEAEKLELMDEVITVQQQAIGSYQVQDDIKSYFENDRNANGQFTPLAKKAIDIRRYFDHSQNNRQSHRLESRAIQAVQEELSQTRLPATVLSHLQGLYDRAKKESTRYRKMSEELITLESNLSSYAIDPLEERYLAGIRESLDYLQAAWQTSTEQFQELLQLPSNQKTFELIPLIELGEKQQTDNMNGVPNGTIDKELFRDLRKMYLERVRQTESVL